MSDPVQVFLVVGGKWHDMDYARLELLKLLAEHEDVRTHIAEDYRDVEAIGEADLLITYTCDLRLEDAQQQALSDFVTGGKRWFALHGTNSVMEFTAGGVEAPRTHRTLMETLGSQFIAHPPIQPYRVIVSDAGHPLVQGVEPFEVDDELYLCEYHGDIHPLLETRYTGKALGFAAEEWPDDEPRIVMYLHRFGEGEVLYLTLGHCRGRWDMRPMIPEYPQVERCSWELPVFHELVRRGIRWARGDA